MKLSRTFVAFFIFGLVNNVLYVVILTAAHDLVSPTTPKSVILLADILPAFLLKLTLPMLVKNAAFGSGTGDQEFIGGAVDDAANLVSSGRSASRSGLGINYPLRLTIVVLLSSLGILLTSLPASLIIIICGIVMASLSSGLGEVTFLQLSHYYNHGSLQNNIAINGWSCGTGGAGLCGSGVVLLFTTIMNVPVAWVLRFFAIVPFVHLWIYYGYLPPPMLESAITVSDEETHPMDTHNDDANTEAYIDDTLIDKKSNNKASFIKGTFPKIERYFLVYMLPLSVVYFAEYAINQGVAPTMLFPLTKTPFKTFRDSYVAYGTIYQVGVFVSRSSGSFVRINKLYLMGCLQFANLLICVLQSLYMIIPSIWIVFLLIFYEGLLGGAAYVNTFIRVSEEIEVEEREFALGCVGISDSFGIVLAATFSLWMEPALCNYQVGTGRDWCTRK